MSKSFEQIMNAWISKNQRKVNIMRQYKKENRKKQKLASFMLIRSDEYYTAKEGSFEQQISSKRAKLTLIKGGRT